MSARGGRFRSTLGLVRCAHRSMFLAKGTNANGSAFLGCIYRMAGGGRVMLTPANVTTVGTNKDALRDFFGLPFCPLLPSSPGFDLGSKGLRDFLGCASTRQGLVGRMRLIVVSRVSVIQTSVVSFVSGVLQMCSRGVHRPFKNGRVLLMKSIFRLRPIVGGSRHRVVGHFCPAPCFFSTQIFRRVRLMSVRLAGMCHRSSGVFIGMLSRVQAGATKTTSLRLLGAHCGARVRRGRDSVCVALTAQESAMSFVGRGGLSRLPKRSAVLANRVRKRFPRDDLPARVRLRMGPKTRVVFVGGSCSRH